MNSNKLMKEKYQILVRILTEISEIPEQQLLESLDFCVAGMVSKVQDVRDPARKCFKLL